MYIVIYKPASDETAEKLLSKSYLRRGDRHWYSAATNLYNNTPGLRPSYEPTRHPRTAPEIVDRPSPTVTRYRMAFGYQLPTGTVVLDAPVIIEVGDDW